MAQNRETQSKAKDAMTEDDLASLCSREWQDADGSLPIIRAERERGLNSYEQRPYGNEEDGLSSFVASDIRDVVEWTLPQLVDLFVGGDTPVAFSAENAEDAQAADIEARYCQYVFERQNPGVIIAYQWIKDALIQKNGIVKAWWQEKDRVEREEYKGKTIVEYLELSNDPELEVDEVTIVINDREYSEEEFFKVLSSFTTATAAAEIEEAALFNIVGHRKSKIGQIKIEVVPPENFMIKKGWNSIFLQDCPYTADYQILTRSDLIEEGYDPALVESLPAHQEVNQVTNEKQNRNRKENNSATSQGVSNGDKSRDEIIVYNHYIRADYDNDDVAELRYVRTAGAGCKYVLDNIEVDRNIYHGITPYLNCHRFFGSSVSDVLDSLQRAKSQLMRNVFDNIQYSSIPRKIVTGSVNVDDLLSFVPGGIIRAGVGGTVTNDEVPFVAKDCLGVAEVLDEVRAERTGFSRDTAGLNPEALADSTNLMGMTVLSQSQLLTKMMATIIAHSGFASLMLHIREMVMKYEDQEKIFDLTGEYLKTDPRGWRKQRSGEVRVGIGYAGKMEAIATTERIIALQEKAADAQGGINGPLVNQQGIFNSISKLLRTTGVKDVKNYFQDPKEYTPPPPPPPSLLEIQAKADIDDRKAKNRQADAKNTLEFKKQKDDNAFRLAELQQKENLAVMEIDSREEIAMAELRFKYGEKASKQVDAREDREIKVKIAQKRQTTAKKTAKSKKED